MLYKSIRIRNNIIKGGYIKIGGNPLDQLIDGVPEGIITQVYGEHATGKTTFCLMCCKYTLLKGKKSVFIDTESGFSPKRLSLMGVKNLEDIIVFQPRDFASQEITLVKLEKIMSTRIGFVCVDSLVSLYRLEGHDHKKRTELARQLGNDLLILSRIARDFDIPLVITNQVYDDVTGSREKIPIGGDVLKYWSKLIIKLEKDDQNKRKATLVRHPYKKEGESAYYDIGDPGIIDVSS
ncbi:MAG: DNA repair and recombination protein RadB [Candidatus Methanofastidiosum sp.]|nr:DNA repair and recombination protein RadB [Methanofastidiosum sp.]